MLHATCERLAVRTMRSYNHAMCRAVFFHVQDSFGHGGTLTMAGLFLLIYQSCLQPSAGTCSISMPPKQSCQRVITAQLLAAACRPAFFLALDSFGHGGTLARAGLFLLMYQSFARPRAVLWQMYLVTAAIIYACTGMAYFLSQVQAL